MSNQKQEGQDLTARGIWPGKGGTFKYGDGLGRPSARSNQRYAVILVGALGSGADDGPDPDDGRAIVNATGDVSLDRYSAASAADRATEEFNDRDGVAGKVIAYRVGMRWEPAKPRDVFLNLTVAERRVLNAAIMDLVDRNTPLEYLIEELVDLFNVTELSARLAFGNWLIDRYDEEPE